MEPENNLLPCHHLHTDASTLPSQCCFFPAPRTVPSALSPLSLPLPKCRSHAPGFLGATLCTIAPEIAASHTLQCCQSDLGESQSQIARLPCALSNIIGCSLCVIATGAIGRASECYLTNIALLLRAPQIGLQRPTEMACLTFHSLCRVANAGGNPQQGNFMHVISQPCSSKLNLPFR